MNIMLFSGPDKVPSLNNKAFLRVKSNKVQGAKKSVSVEYTTFTMGSTKGLNLSLTSSVILAKTAKNNSATSGALPFIKASYSLGTDIDDI